MKHLRAGRILSEDIEYGGILMFRKGTVVSNAILDVLKKLQLSDKVHANFDERESLICDGHSSRMLFDILAGKSVGKRYLILRDRLYSLLQKVPKDLISMIENVGVLPHSTSVALYSASMAVQDGLGMSSVDNCLLGGFLHDIGKTRIDANILNKRGRLTSEEFKIVTEHTTLGAQILSEYKMPEFVIECALSHHENSSGSGYPNGVKSKDLPIEIAYMHLVDIYDAMSSERVYKHSLSRASARKFLSNDSQFSEELIRTFLQAVPVLLPGECTYINSMQFVLEDVMSDTYTLQLNSKRVQLSADAMEAKLIKGGIWR